MFDLDYVVHEVWRYQRPLRTDRILASGIELHLTATDVDTTEQVDLSQLADDEQIRAAILASSRLPWLAGPPVSFRGRRLLDPTLSSAIPIDAPRRTVDRHARVADATARGRPLAAVGTRRRA